MTKSLEKTKIFVFFRVPRGAPYLTGADGAGRGASQPKHRRSAALSEGREREGTGRNSEAPFAKAPFAKAHFRESAFRESALSQKRLSQKRLSRKRLS